MIFVNSSVDLKKLCAAMEDMENSYFLKGEYNEFIRINKSNREITHLGMSGILVRWLDEGLISSTNIR